MQRIAVYYYQLYFFVIFQVFEEQITGLPQQRQDVMAEAADSGESYLEDSHKGVTILALRMSSRKRLGMYLNQDALPLQNGLLPNYQGLAECIGFEFIEQLSFQRDKDPTQSLLMEWGNRPDFSPTLGNLVKYLLQLERIDVLDDCQEIISKIPAA